jgi:hypothetical protein
MIGGIAKEQLKQETDKRKQVRDFSSLYVCNYCLVSMELWAWGIVEIVETPRG